MKNETEKVPCRHRYSDGTQCLEEEISMVHVQGQTSAHFYVDEDGKLYEIHPYSPLEKGEGTEKKNLPIGSLEITPITKKNIPYISRRSGVSESDLRAILKASKLQKRKRKARYIVIAD